MAKLNSLTVNGKQMSDFVVSRNNYFNIDNDGRYWVVTNWASGFVEIDLWAHTLDPKNNPGWVKFDNDRYYAGYSWALPETITTVVSMTVAGSGQLSYASNVWVTDNTLNVALVHWWESDYTDFGITAHIAGYK